MRVRLFTKHPEDFLRLDDEQREVALRALTRLRKRPEMGKMFDPPKEHQRSHFAASLEGLRSVTFGGRQISGLGANLPVKRAISIIYRWTPSNEEGVLEIISVGLRLGSEAHRVAAERLLEVPGKGQVRRSPTRTRTRRPDYREGN